MDLGLIFLIYTIGIILIIAEAMLPGWMVGMVGLVAVITGVVMGFGHHWLVGAGQISLALVVTPVAFTYGIKRLALNTTLANSDAFAKDYEQYMGREADAWTDLRPAGTITLDGRKVDVVTAGEPVARGKRVRVVKVEGNRVVVRAI